MVRYRTVAVDDHRIFYREAGSPEHVSLLPLHGFPSSSHMFRNLIPLLAAFPVITVPTITLQGDADGAPRPDPASYAKKFSGKYAHRLIKGGIGHNPSQEAPQAFAKAVVEVDGY